MRKHLLAGIAAATVVAVLPLTAISAKADVNSATATSVADFGGMSGLVAAAEKEGTLNITTVLRNWANYGAAVDNFQAVFGIKINDDNPNGSSSYEINSIKTAPADAQPDVVDIGASHIADAAGLFANYKVQTWNDIPADWKDANGNWFGNYAGQIVIGYDTKLKKKPTKLSDLLDPSYKGKVAIAGDPTGAQEALMSVFAVNQSQGGTPDNLKPAIAFFHKLKAAGNFVTAPADATHIANGSVKVWLDWSFNAPGTIAQAKTVGKNIAYAIPTDAQLVGTPYIFGVNAKAPHPAAARLWVEYMMAEQKGMLPGDLAGDEYDNQKQGKLTGEKAFNSLMGGQNIFAIGGATPILADAMKKKKLLVSSPVLAAVKSTVPMLRPTVDQQHAAVAYLKTAWPTI